MSSATAAVSEFTEPVVRGGISTTALISLALAGMVALAVIWLSTGLVAADRWPIQWLEVDGQFQRISAEQVRSELSDVLDAGFFAVDLATLRERLEALPWVAAARVSKRWPDTVSVRILERRPVARWAGDTLISDEGVRFDVPGSQRLQGLPVLTGPDDRFEEVIRRWQEWRRQLTALGQDVDEIHLSDRGAWRLVMSNAVVLHLGRDLSEQRMQRLLALYPALVRGREALPLAIDLRYSNGVAVRWPPVAPTDAAPANQTPASETDENGTALPTVSIRMDRRPDAGIRSAAAGHPSPSSIALTAMVLSSTQERNG